MGTRMDHITRFVTAIVQKMKRLWKSSIDFETDSGHVLEYASNAFSKSILQVEVEK